MRKYIGGLFNLVSIWTQVVLDNGWKHLATQDLWSKVQPSLSTDVMMPMGRGRKDMCSVVYTVSMATMCVPSSNYCECRLNHSALYYALYYGHYM